MFPNTIHLSVVPLCVFVQVTDVDKRNLLTCCDISRTILIEQIEARNCMFCKILSTFALEFIEEMYRGRLNIFTQLLKFENWKIQFCKKKYFTIKISFRIHKWSISSESKNLCVFAVLDCFFIYRNQPPILWASLVTINICFHTDYFQIKSHRVDYDKDLSFEMCNSDDLVKNLISERTTDVIFTQLKMKQGLPGYYYI